jgi:hypothetical protein
MASKYRVTVNFDLETEISPEGVERHFESGNVDFVDFEDQSYFSTQSVTCDGGEIVFTVEADSEDAAEDLAREVMDDGSEYEDDNGFTWVSSGVQYSIEAEEYEPTVEEAVEVLSTWVEENVGDGSGEGVSRVAKAAQVVLDDHARLGRRVADLETRVAGLDEQIRQLSARLAEVAPPQG